METTPATWDDRPSVSRERCPLCHEPLHGTPLARCRGCDTSYHQACHGELGGCSTLGCAQGPQAPQEPAPAKGGAKAPPPARVATLAAGLALSYGAFWVVWPFALVPWLATLVAARRSWRQLALVAALCPFVGVPALSFANGVAGYVTGTATLWGVGLPGLEYHNLDPVARCRRSSSGCLVDGSEVLTHAPNNLAIRGLTALFGPQPGAYRGPYPDRAAATALVAQGDAVTLAALRSGSLTLGGRPVELAANTALAVERELRDLANHGVVFYGPDGPMISTSGLRAALLDDEGLVVGGSCGVVLVGLADGSVVARYFAGSDRWR